MSLSKLLSSPDALEKLTLKEREDVTSRLLSLLGNAFTRSASEDKIIKIEHQPSGMVFTLIPGGIAKIGLHPGDILEIAQFIDLELIEYSIEVDGASALPPRLITIPPFLCSCKPLAIGTVSRSEAIARVGELGFRLPSEVELEWILRDGGKYALTLGAEPVNGKAGRFNFRKSRYGVESLLVANWAADDWHPNYDGALTTAAAWENEDLSIGSSGVCRSTFPLDAMVSEEDIAVLLAALRSRGDQNMPAVARLVMDLPSEC